MTKRDVLVLPSDGLDPINRYLLSSTLDEEFGEAAAPIRF